MNAPAEDPTNYLQVCTECGRDFDDNLFAESDVAGVCRLSRDIWKDQALEQSEKRLASLLASKIPVAAFKARLREIHAEMRAAVRGEHQFSDDVLVQFAEESEADFAADPERNKYQNEYAQRMRRALRARAARAVAADVAAEVRP